MAKNSSISWTNHTFNPWRGCTKVSPGCANCYAETMDKRFGGDRWGPGKARERTSPANWREPLKWNAEAARLGIRYRVFCASLADWLDPEVPVEWLADLLLLITRTPHLDWLLLTKRPESWCKRLEDAVDDLALTNDPLDDRANVNDTIRLGQAWLRGTAPANVWVGATVEDQQRANERIPALLSIPARVRFLSCEPLLEAVTLSPPDQDGGRTTVSWLEYGCTDERIDWVICGGESGPKARTFNLAWARSLRDQCAMAGVPFFMKQLGARPLIPHQVAVNGHATGPKMLLPYRVLDRAGADPAEWPADLRIQQFPEVR